MDKQIYRSIILHLHNRGNPPSQIHEELVQTYGEEAPSYSTVKYWVRSFRFGVKSVDDAPREGRPNSAIMQQNIDDIARMIEHDPKIGIRTLASNTHTSHGTTATIIHHHLRLKKLYAKWVPHSLTEVQKEARVRLARRFIRMFGANFDTTKARLITSDETWVLYDTPDTAETSREWTPDGAARPQRAKISPRSEKVMLTVWWDAKGIIMLDFWKKSNKVSFNGSYYRDMVARLRKDLPKQRRGMMKAGPLVLIDNAPVHAANETRLCFENCGFELVEMPPYSPDIAPSDFYLFRNLKTWLRGCKFATEEELVGEVTSWLESKPPSYYERGISQLKERMRQVVESGGEYLDA